MIEAQLNGPLKTEAIALFSALAVVAVRLAAWIASRVMAKGSKPFQKASFEFGDVRLTVVRRTSKSSPRRARARPSKTGSGSATSQAALPMTEPSEPQSLTSQRSALTDLPLTGLAIDAKSFDPRYDAY